MKKHILFLSISFWICSFYSCSEDPVLNNPFGGGDFNPILTSLSHEIDGSTISVGWDGNQFAFEFSYRYKIVTDEWPESAWSGWSTIKEISIPYLDEGEYIFQVKSRFEEGIEEENPDSFTFLIDAITGPSLRFFPLYKEVENLEGFTMDIYAEEVENLIGAEIEFTYDKNLVSFDTTMAGSFLLTMPDNILIQEHDQETGAVLLTIATALDTGEGLTGSGSLAQISFTSLTSGTFELNFYDNPSQECPWHGLSEDHSTFVNYSTPYISDSFTSLINATIMIE